MPRKGWKTITVSEEIYNYFWVLWDSNKDNLRLKNGVTSFSGFISKILYDVIENDRFDSIELSIKKEKV